MEKSSVQRANLDGFMILIKISVNSLIKLAKLISTKIKMAIVNNAISNAFIVKILNTAFNVLLDITSQFKN